MPAKTTTPRAVPAAAAGAVVVAIHLVVHLVVLGGLIMPSRSTGAADLPNGPRAEAWKRVQEALDEGKPKSAREALAGVEEAAIAEQAWAEAARAIATRIVAEAGDRPADDPQRLVLLARAIDQAPPQTRPVLEAIRANWTWRYFEMNRWRFQQRTSGGAAADDLAQIAEWDLPAIVGEIRARFAVALDGGGALETLPVGEWTAVIAPGSMPDAYRPTVGDVVVRDAIAFAASGERGLADPEDAFELEAGGPALGTPDEFRAWKPEESPAVTDADSPLLHAARLYRRLLDAHAADVDRTAFLAADLDRILWAAGNAVDSGDATVTDRKADALESFIARAGDHAIAALAMHELATVARGANDLVAAHALAEQAARRHPTSPGGRLCKNLLAEIESRQLSLATERTWAAPWPVVRVTYRSIEQVHLRLAKADWTARLGEGKPRPGWLDDDDRREILALPAVKTLAVALPATTDFQAHEHDIPVAGAFDPQGLEPGAYWVIASHAPDFNAAENVVAATLVWITRMAIVTAHAAGTHAPTGHVVDIASGEPVVGATVTAWVREERGNPAPFVARGSTTTDEAGRYELPMDHGREHLLVASAAFEGRTHAVATESTHVWREPAPQDLTTIVLVTDRGIHRPGQTVFYKGIACAVDAERRDPKALAKAAITVTLRDANGREVATAQHTTSAVGSFHGSFPLPTGALPGQWAIHAVAAGHAGGVAVRVEEYKRPKYLVELQAPSAAVKLLEAVAVPGKAVTYTGLPVAGARVRWRVERQMRLPMWCRWCLPWLPFGTDARKIARGSETTAADGSFTIRFPALPDRGVPKDALPVFTYRVVADVTDSGGETRTSERSISAGYADLQAAIAVDACHAVMPDARDLQGRPTAEVTVAVTTTSLDGAALPASGTLTVRPLVQPDHIDRGALVGSEPVPKPQPFGTARRAQAAARPPEPVPQPSDPDTWAGGEAVFTREQATDPATGRAEATVNLPPGIYRAEFVAPGTGDVPEVRAQATLEVLDPTADRYPVRRAFAMRPLRTTIEAGREFEALVGTGYDRGRALVELSQSGRVLRRFWTEAGRTQWPVRFAVGDGQRGGFTLTSWLVRDGRLHRDECTIDVPWTNKKLAVTWERFTRRVEPAAREIWRARVTSVADPLAGPEAPVAAELLALLYDQSLDALAAHQWPGDGLLNVFRRESGGTSAGFTNAAEPFNPLCGDWGGTTDDVEISYRELREPFGPPGWGRGMWMGRGSGPVVMMSAAAAPQGAVFEDADDAETRIRRKGPDGPGNGTARGGDDGTGAGLDRARAAQPPPRHNLVETAFFLPAVTSGSNGVMTIEFTLPDTLTTWQFKGLAHDAALRSGTLVDACVAARDLMVEPLVPRFVREGDVVQIPVKVGNASTARLSGTVRFALADARTNDSRDDLIDGPREQAFDVAAGETQPVVFTVRVADGTDVLRYTATGAATGSARPLADGEEALLPVLPRRVLVTETVPLTIRGPGERRVTLERLAESAGTEIRSQSLVVQATANPAWYGVLALPCLMEENDECVETLFARLYANSLARHVATSDPRIGRVFAQWKGGAALESPLEKNTELVTTLLAETPWTRDAVDERESRARIALLFDATRAADEVRSAVARLETLRNGDGGWPWFPGGQSCDPVTLAIIAGFGRLRTHGVPIDVQPALAALPWLDGRLVEEQRRAEGIEDPVLTPVGAFALYARSFFTADAPPQGAAAEAIRWGLRVGATSWKNVAARRSQGHLALALHRAGDREAARSIVESLRQRAVDADVRPGAEQASWQGMWWRDPHPSWWSWASAPIETQTIMIEAFDEVAGDAAAVEAMKAWLLAQKRTSRWPGTVATADAAGVLFGRGSDLLAAREPVSVVVGGEAVVAGAIEAGTGFFEARFVQREITPAMGRIVMTKADPGLAWGGVHWQYLDDVSRVSAAGREELAIAKTLFVKRFTKAGPVLEPVEKDGATTVEVGDEIVVRLAVTSDRDYEFLELVDQRPSVAEPVDVLSGWRFGDGAAWYLAIRDASTQLFFERLPRGTHVFEYALRAAHRGTASSGFATIRSRYAPEFSARSASVPLEAK